MTSINRICDISYIHLLISPYVFLISRFRICSIALFCDITNSCPFSYDSTLTARADLFLEYVLLSHAFHAAKFELDNGRHFGLNNILFIIRYIHAYIQTIQLTIGSDDKHSAYMKVVS